MYNLIQPKIVVLLFILFGSAVSAQEITVKADTYKHQFEGAGVSIGLYMGHHYSMNSLNQDKAIKLIAKDCNMMYLQDYIQIYPSDDPVYFDRRANYIKAAKVYQPNIKVSMVGNKFPDDLMHEIVVNGETYDALNTDDPEIYDKLANWFFELFKGFHDRGVPVEVLNVVNEPDLDRVFRKQHYGLNGNTKVAVARIFEQAVPKFKAMLNDPEINTTNMPIPLIMGPSTISTTGCLDYVRYFKSEHPNAWNQIDIVSTHQYENGSSDLTFKNIVNEIEGKPLHQSETHAFVGDDLGSLPVDKPLRTVLSLSNLFGTAVTNGVSAWYYFENNYPDDFHPGGLIRVPWATSNPTPYKHYYAFKQLTSAQPAFSHIVEHEVLYGSKSEVTTFRKMDEDTVYVHYSNYASVSRPIKVTVEEVGLGRKIIGMSSRVTDADLNDVTTMDTVFTEYLNDVTYNAPRFSVNTLKITLKSGTSGFDLVPEKESNIKMTDFGDHIKISALETDPLVRVIIYSINGKIVGDVPLKNHGGYSIMKDNFPHGIFLLKIITANASYSRKIIF